MLVLFCRTVACSFELPLFLWQNSFMIQLWFLAELFHGIPTCVSCSAPYGHKFSKFALLAKKIILTQKRTRGIFDKLEHLAAISGPLLRISGYKIIKWANANMLDVGVLRSHSCYWCYRKTTSTLKYYCVGVGVRCILTGIVYILFWLKPKSDVVTLMMYSHWLDSLQMFSHSVHSNVKHFPQPRLHPKIYSPWLLLHILVCFYPQPWFSIHAELVTGTAHWTCPEHVYSSLITVHELCAKKPSMFLHPHA